MNSTRHPTRAFSSAKKLALSSPLNRRTLTLLTLGVTGAVATLVFLVQRESVVEKVHANARASYTLASSSADSDVASFETHWRQLSAAPLTAARERDRRERLADFATHHSQRALALAFAETDARLRRELAHAALRGWAAVDPFRAAQWAEQRPPDERVLAMPVVFAGAARHADAAIRLARDLSSLDPARAGDYGEWLIDAFSAIGDHAAAVHFARTASSVHQGAWLNSTFDAWASREPEKALSAVNTIDDARARHASFRGLVTGWAASDPAALAHYAIDLPPGPNRSTALNEALPQWVKRHPIEAAEWLLRFDPLPDLDAGAEAAATHPRLVQNRPDLALGWAASIVDPTLRANTLRLLAETWVQRDRTAVQRFLVSTPNLPASDRSALLDGLNPSPDP